MPSAGPRHLPLSPEEVLAYQEWARSHTGPAPFGNLEDPLDQFAMIRQLAEASADDPDVLGWIAVAEMEALIDLHWPQVINEVVAAATTSAALRRVISGCYFDDATPASVLDRLTALVGPDDDVGHGPA